MDGQTTDLNHSSSSNLDGPYAGKIFYCREAGDDFLFGIVILEGQGLTEKVSDPKTYRVAKGEPMNELVVKFNREDELSFEGVEALVYLDQERQVSKLEPAAVLDQMLDRHFPQPY